MKHSVSSLVMYILLLLRLLVEILPFFKRRIQQELHRTGPGAPQAVTDKWAHMAPQSTQVHRGRLKFDGGRCG